MRVWRFVASYLEREGFPPTLREIGDGCFISHTAAQLHLVKLEERGVLELRANTPRGIKLLEQPPPPGA
jgi:repressor LexA